MAPYKALYGSKYQTFMCWKEVGDMKLIGFELVQLTPDKVRIINNRMKSSIR